MKKNKLNVIVVFVVSCIAVLCTNVCAQVLEAPVLESQGTIQPSPINDIVFVFKEYDNDITKPDSIEFAVYDIESKTYSKTNLVTAQSGRSIDDMNAKVDLMDNTVHVSYIDYWDKLYYIEIPNANPLHAKRQEIKIPNRSKISVWDFALYLETSTGDLYGVVALNDFATGGYEIYFLKKPKISSTFSIKLIHQMPTGTGQIRMIRDHRTGNFHITTNPQQLFGPPATDLLELVYNPNNNTVVRRSVTNNTTPLFVAVEPGKHYSPRTTFGGYFATMGNGRLNVAGNQGIHFAKWKKLWDPNSGWDNLIMLSRGGVTSDAQSRPNLITPIRIRLAIAEGPVNNFVGLAQEIFLYSTRISSQFKNWNKNSIFKDSTNSNIIDVVAITEEDNPRGNTPEQIAVASSWVRGELYLHFSQDEKSWTTTMIEQLQNRRRAQFYVEWLKQ